VSEDRSLLASMLPASASALTIEQAQAVAGLLRAFTMPVQVGAVPALPFDISSFTTAERRQVTDLLLELGERARTAGTDDLPALASVLSYLEGVLAAAIGEANTD
jgi:hypothetical protein